MFNTLKYAKMLQEVGFSKEQAETSIGILVDIMEDKLATKQDFKNYELVSQRDFAQFKSEVRFELEKFRAEILHLMLEREARLESKLTIRFGAMQAATIAILAAIIKLT
ncbi:MAG: DUF1640 domain-containing protein [Xanthomonadaceae bacterium]|nr:DUF1640 domain-containing protein [Xanthomonadaceae bacterium]